MVSRQYSRSQSPASSRGHVLFEALLSLAVIGLGAMPLAMLGTMWLRWSGEQEGLTTALRLATELAEGGTSGLLATTGSDTHPASLCEMPAPEAGCEPGNRLAIANIESRSPTDAPGVATMPTRLALWVTP